MLLLYVNCDWTKTAQEHAKNMENNIFTHY